MAWAKGPLIHSAVRHSVAIVAVLLAFVLRQLLFSTTGIHLGPLFALFPAVIFSALLLGLWPGLSSSVFATVLAYYGLFLPLGNMSGKTPSDRASLIIFLIVSIVFSIYAERFRRANRGAASGGEIPASFLDRLTSFLSQQVEEAIIFGPRKVAAGQFGLVRRVLPLVLLRTAVAMLAFGVGLLLRLALIRLFGVSLPPFLTFFPVILAAALFSGFWSGFLATLLSSSYTLVWIFEPKGLPSIQRSEDAVTLFLYLLFGAAISAVCEGFRRRQRRIAKLDSEHAAWENRAKLEAAIESMSEGVFITDADGKLVDANRAFLRRFRSPDATQRLPNFEEVHRFLDLDYPGGGPVPLEQRPVQRALRGETATNQEYVLRHKLTGESWLASCNFSPILNGHAIAGTVVSARDISGQRQLQRDLQSSEARYRATFQTNLDAIVLLRLRDQHYIDCNDALVGLVGFTREEILGGTPRELQVWADSEAHLEMIRRLKESGSCREYQARFRRKDGALIWVLLSAALLEIEGEPCILSIVRDITAVVQSQDALRASEERYRQLFLSSQDTLAVTRVRDHAYIEVNDEFLRTSGFTREEIVGKTSGQVGIWANRGERDGLTKRLFENGSCRDYPATFRRKDGEIRQCVLSASFIELSGERCILTVARDVTENLKAEEARRASEKRYRAAFESRIEAIAITRLSDGLMMDANRKWMELMGWQREEYSGQHTGELASWERPEDREQYAATIQEHPEGAEITARLKRKDGTAFWAMISGVRMEFAGDLCILSSVRDISAAREAEEARRAIEERYRAAFETSFDGITVLSLDMDTLVGTYIDANERALEITGLKREELLGHTPSELGLWADPVELEARVKVLRAQGYFQDVEESFRRPDGEMRLILSSGTYLEIDGRPCLLVTFKDITLARQAKEALRNSEERYRTAFETSQDGIAIIRLADSTYLDVNPAFLRITHWDREDIVGRSTEERSLFTQAADRRYLRELFTIEDHCTGGPFELKGKGGVIFWGVTTRTVMEIDGVPCAHVVLRDVTAERQAEKALRASDERYRTAFETSRDPIAIFNQQNQTILDINGQFARTFGWSREEILGHTTIELNMDVSPDDRREILDELASKGAVQDALMPLRRKNGEIFWAVLSGAMMEIDGAPCSYITARDVTAQRLAEQALRASENRYRTVFQTSLDPITIVRTSDGVFLEVSHSFLEFTGWKREEVVGHTTADLALWADRHIRAEVNASLDRGEPVVNFQAEFRKKSGESFWGLMTSTRFEMEGESCTLSVIRDLTAARRAEAEIRHLSFFDPLTGLANRRQLDERLKESIETCVASSQHLALLCIDLDNFQTANNAFGHANGDLILRQIAERIGDCVHSSDIVARPGGDEYFVFLDRLDANRETAAEKVRAITEEIMTRVEMPCRIGEHEFTCTCSVGITLTNSRLRSVSELLQQADIAMHQAKEAGRNTFRFFSPDLQEAVSARASLEEDLRLAIKEEQFVLYYQPQVERGRLIGAEALVRWQHPRLGLLAPDNFIHLAENTSLILPLGNWVLSTACQQIARWAKAFPASTLSVSVNISALQLRQEDFVQTVLDVVESTGADPRRLKLELTESMLAENIQDAITKMRALQPKGVSFSLDDFGTGYSSLAYLKLLPLAQLKIDRSFVKDILTDPGSAAIAQTIISLSHALGVPVIAEGVETEEQRGMLAGLGCHAYQGYLFGRPNKPEEIEKRLRQ
jgi:diguanylate cyclase (GGDEF)-like protein/PAS domain S-box-containing protein